jgi:hypothetical protein
VLAFLIDQYPTRVTVDELHLALDAKDFAEEDATSRAVCELTAVGLLRPEGELIGPSRAALHFERLERD